MLLAIIELHRTTISIILFHFRLHNETCNNLTLTSVQAIIILPMYYDYRLNKSAAYTYKACSRPISRIKDDEGGEKEYTVELETVTGNIRLT